MNGKILYKEICNDIVKKINQGEYKKGDYLPSQAELSEQYHT
ncbi:MAG: GntR family transcriptional regulator, partial [Clostridia bacterium]|nr:GntR family transcriptional regulator [Clostridia bacterium]